MTSRPSVPILIATVIFLQAWVERGPTGLQVEGCLLAFCGSEVWTRTR
jgi:hypothetical protein